MQTLRGVLTAWETALNEMSDCLGYLQRQVADEGDYADHMQQVLSDDITRLNGLLVEKDQAIQDLERVRAGQANRIADLIQHGNWRREEIEALQRVIGEQGAGLREKDREISALGADLSACRTREKRGREELARLGEALRQSNYQRDNAIADKTTAQAVTTKAWEEAAGLRQQVQELRRQVKIG